MGWVDFMKYSVLNTPKQRLCLDHKTNPVHALGYKLKIPLYKGRPEDSFALFLMGMRDWIDGIQELTRHLLDGQIVDAILELHRLEESSRGRGKRLIRHGHVVATQAQCLDQQGRGPLQILERYATGVLTRN